MRDKITGGLRVVRREAHPPGMEPLAQLIRDAMDAEGLSQADVVRITKLKRQHVSQLLNRRVPYTTRPPTIETLTALELIKGLTARSIAEAVARSTGIGVTTEEAKASANLRTARALLEKFPEDQLPRVVQVLIAMLD